MAKGAAWMVLFKLLERSIGLVSTLVLARLLVPADFGIVAMATSVIAVLEILAGFSFDLALIQKQDAERRHYDTAWTLNILTWGTMAVLMVAAAAPVAAFYREPRVEHVLYALAIGTFAIGFENIGVVAFRKELTLDKEFYFLLAKKLVAAATGITVAVIFRSYWALVAGMVVSRVVGSALSYLMHPFRPRWSLAGARELMHFSRWLFVLAVQSAVVSRAPDFIVGRVAGPAALGAYNLGQEISNLPTTELVLPISRALFPGYARMAHEQGELRRGFLAVVALLVLLAVPAAAGIAVLAHPLVSILLGEKWLAVVPIIAVLAPYGLLMALHTSAGHLLIATGHAKAVTGLAMVQIAILIPGLVLGVRLDGAVGAAHGALVTAAVMVPLTYAWTLRAIGARVRDYARLLWRPLLAAAAMTLCVTLWMRWLDAVGLGAVHLIVVLTSVCVGAPVYAILVLLLWRLAGMPSGAESYLLRMARAKLRGAASDPARAGRDAG